MLAQGDPHPVEVVIVVGAPVVAVERTSEEQAKPEATLAGSLRIVSVGQADLDGEGGVRVPLVLGDSQGQTRSIVLSLRLDPLLDPLLEEGSD